MPAERHACRGFFEAQQPEQVRQEFRVTPPADRVGRVRRVVRRLVGQRRHVRRRAASHGGSEERGTERQHAAAVAGRALREHDHAAARSESPLEDRQHAQQIALARAVDEHRADGAAQPAEQRPARDVGLRDEGRAQRRAEHDRVEVAQVVRDQQERAARRLAAARDAQPDDARRAARPVVEEREAKPRAAIGAERCDALDRHDRDRGDAEPGREQARPEQAAQAMHGGLRQLHGADPDGRKRRRLRASRSPRSNSTR